MNQLPSITKRSVTVGLIIGTLLAIPVSVAFVHYVLTPWQRSNCQHGTTGCPPGTIGKATFEGNALWCTCRVECIPVEQIQASLEPMADSSLEAPAVQ